MPRVKRVRRPVKVSPLLRKKIKKVIQATAEKKFLPVTLFDALYYSTTETSWGGPVPGTTTLTNLCTPLLTVGRGQTSTTFIGDSFMLKSYRLVGHFYHNTTAPGGGLVVNLPVITTMYIVSMKKFPTSTLEEQFPPVPAVGPPPLGPTGGCSNWFLEQDAFVKPTGVLVDMERTVNFEQYKIHYKRVFRTGPQSGITQTAALPNIGNRTYRLSNKFDIDVRKFFPSKITRLEVGAAPAQVNAANMFIILQHQTEFNYPAFSPHEAQAPLAFASPIVPPKMSFRLVGSFTDT